MMRGGGDSLLHADVGPLDGKASRDARVAPIGDTEMLSRALGPGAGLVTHRRACPPT
jgi:hypothetical protein